MVSKRNFNYSCDDIHILYFGERFDKTKIRMNLTRENYAVIDKKSYSHHANNVLLCWEEYLKNEKTSKSETVALNKFDINNKELLSDEYCKQYQELCLKNYDLNMNFMNKLSKKEFNNLINQIVNKYKMIEITKLEECKRRKGIYLAVLDFYKQVYIGQTRRDLRERILTHWKVKPKFDNVLSGTYNEAVISYNSYGVLDTTRIFVVFEENTEKIDIIEKELTQKIPLKFQANIVAGGIHLDTLADYLQLGKTWNIRKLTE